MTIKHLVFSGGGPIMIQTMAAVQELVSNDYLHMNDIQTMYGTSAGAILAVVFSLDYDWQTLNDYIIKRPWHELFSIKVQHILDSYSKKGIFDSSTVEKCFKPLFDAKDISINITLNEFYKLTNKEIHLFTFEINKYTLIDISYITHPDLKLMTAIQMSCALPILVTPVFLDNHCFIDGGLACNYPLQFCIESGKNPDEILGFKNKYSDNTTIIHNESTMLDYILHFLFKAVFSIEGKYAQPVIKNQLLCDTSYITFDSLRSAITSVDIRRDLFEKGVASAKVFLLQNCI